MNLLRRLIRSRALRLLLVTAFWLGVWEVLALAVAKPLLLPDPISVFKRLFALLGTADFYRVTANSLRNILAGFLLAAVGGVLLAALTSRISLLRALLQPVMTVVKATPVASFIILAMLWMGTAKVPSFITALIVLPVVWTNLDIGYKTVDPSLLEMTKAYRFSPWRRFRYLTLPTLRPYFVSSVRMAIGLAWKAGVAAEILVMPRSSIGTMIGEAKQYLETTSMFAWTLTVVLLSILIEFAVSALLKRWQDPEGMAKEVTE